MGYVSIQQPSVVQPPVVEQPATPTAQSAPVTITNFGDLELYTTPNPEGVYQIPAGTIGAAWWKVTIDGFNAGDCVGYWLTGGSTYSISSPGRIRVWTSPSNGDLSTFKQWWEDKVQAEASGVCTYTWVTR